MTLYNTIGHGYSKVRLPDERISNALIDLLAVPKTATVMDVGAGTGKYSQALADRGLSVIAIEPSAVMGSQFAPHERVRLIEAPAEVIPLPSGSAAAAFIVLALHHFTDRAKAMNEILRVIGTGPLVVFTFEPSRLGEFWLADYFPKLGKEIRSSFSELPDVGQEIARLTGRDIKIISFPLPRDLKDSFAAAAWASPESYLDPVFRSGISSFSLMPPDEVEEGLDKLKTDLESGRWTAKYGHLQKLDCYDAGYRFIVATHRSP